MFVILLFGKNLNCRNQILLIQEAAVWSLILNASCWMYLKKKKHQFCPLNVSPDSLQSINTLNVGFLWKWESLHRKIPVQNTDMKYCLRSFPGNMEELFKIVSWRSNGQIPLLNHLKVKRLVSFMLYIGLFRIFSNLSFNL